MKIEYFAMFFPMTKTSSHNQSFQNGSWPDILQLDCINTVNTQTRTWLRLRQTSFRLRQK